MAATANSSSGWMGDMFGLLSELNHVEADERFGFNSPNFLIVSIVLYLLFVYKIGPRFMRSREPYRLKEFIAAYNIYQVIACMYIINQIWLLSGWDVFDFNKCISYLPNTPGRKIFDDVTYFTFWLKLTEFIETIVFVLRKKQNQITYLHVFHHASTLTLVYLLLRYYRGNGALYPIFLNSGVHVIMYSYYFVTNLCGPQVIRRLIFVKKFITIIQMIQFVCILSQSALLWKKCKVPAVLRAYYCFVVGAIFYGFYDFYKKAYLKKRTHETATKQS